MLRQGLMLRQSLKAVNGLRGGRQSTVLQYACSFASGTSWVPKEEERLKKVTTQALIHEVASEQMNGVQETVPWFLSSMPSAYFRTVSDDLRKTHLKAITALRALGQKDLSLKIENKIDDNLTDITIMQTTPKTGLLLSQLKSINAPPDSTLSSIRINSSADGDLALNIFSYEKKHVQNESATLADGQKIMAHIESLKSSGGIPPESLHMFSEESLSEYFSRCAKTYVSSCLPERFITQREMFEKVRGTDGTEVHFESHKSHSHDSAAWITIAAGDVQPDELLRTAASVLAPKDIDIYRAHLDTIRDDAKSTEDMSPTAFVTMIRLLVSPDPAKLSTDKSNSNFNEIMTGMRRAKWLDDDVIRLGLVDYPEIGLEKAEIILALCSMLHSPLSKLNPYAFASVKSVTQCLGDRSMYMTHAASIAELFMDKFRPEGNTITPSEFAAKAKALKDIFSQLQNQEARTVLLKMLEATEATLRTNLYLPNRYALSMRIDPTVMAVHPPSAAAPTPFGVIFAYGKRFDAFHCRFRDIARGGLRVVTPNNADQLALESSRHFDEVYGLSLAQQLKNKDIPEGGSKGVILVNNAGLDPSHKQFTVRSAVKAFTDSLLDLITKDGLKGQVDYYKKEELVYLGPDEQIIPDDIQWIVDRAAVRGYPTPAACMSSKKGAGFNHKEFGVTSEGVCVYLGVALEKSLGINPHVDPFTVKITGGPDGDVAGNLIAFLYRDYPNTAKVLGVADGSGVCEDLNGIDRDELLRLVRESLPIIAFDKSKLSSKGLLMDVNTPEGLLRRNTMHFVMKTDAFVPSGGRPNTINNDNWRQFLDSEGKPSSPLIVEGANLFLTKEAREQLYKHGGVQIIKDSSANKCGVITSSAEIAASMLLSREEFLEIKPELVKDVLTRLRYLAAMEAELLFREFANYPGNLPHFSERISGAINKVTDAVTDALAEVNPGDPLFDELLPLIKENLPEKLAEVAWNRVPERFPVQYQRNAIASTLASKLVYQEGIHLVEAQPIERLAARAIMYYRESQSIEKLAAELETAEWSGMDEKKKALVVKLIKKGGARSSLEVF